MTIIASGIREGCPGRGGPTVLERHGEGGSSRHVSVSAVPDDGKHAVESAGGGDLEGVVAGRAGEEDAGMLQVTRTTTVPDAQCWGFQG